MINPELLEQLQAASIDDRIAIIEAILRSLKRDVRSASRQSNAENRPLRGKVRHYDNPYEPVAVEDWETLA